MPFARRTGDLRPHPTSGSYPTFVLRTLTGGYLCLVGPIVHKQRDTPSLTDWPWPPCPRARRHAAQRFWCIAGFLVRNEVFLPRLQPRSCLARPFRYLNPSDRRSPVSASSKLYADLLNPLFWTYPVSVDR
jgi:hypothetical protein